MLFCECAADISVYDLDTAWFVFFPSHFLHSLIKHSAFCIPEYSLKINFSSFLSYTIYDFPLKRVNERYAD